MCQKEELRRAFSDAMAEEDGTQDEEECAPAARKGRETQRACVEGCLKEERATTKLCFEN